MHRVGAPPSELSALVDAITSDDNLSLGGLWTHFSVADEDPVYTRKQIEAFDEAVDGLEAPALHLANTAGAALFPESRRDLCRIGLGIYGLHPCDETRGVVDLLPAMRVVTHVSHVQRLAAGERPSYGRRRLLEEESTVVTAPIGYADGYARGLSDSGSVLLGGKRFPLAGTVTMDQIVIDVGDEDVGVGDEVVVLGSQDGEDFGADEWANALNTISYEVVCSIGPRVPRRYVS
jgi:alanine racemase